MHTVYDLSKKRKSIHIESIHIADDMYKNSQKLYISAIICIKTIHITDDMYKKHQKLYIYFVIKTVGQDGKNTFRSEYSMERHS